MMHLDLTVFVAFEATVHLKFAIRPVQNATTNVYQNENRISLLNFFFESIHVNLFMDFELLNYFFELLEILKSLECSSYLRPLSASEISYEECKSDSCLLCLHL